MAATVLESVLDKVTAAVDPVLKQQGAGITQRIGRAKDEARMLRSAAAEAFEERADEARRALKRAKREMIDAGHDARHRIRRQPFVALGVAFGAGAVLGVAATGLAWLVARSAPRG
jgi:ElaB/YqjD/DUF883 family membrane-anchored ribosome-binding protein